MTSKEFVIWLKGFTEGVHQFNVTPKQWDLLKEKLKEVEEAPQSIGVPTPIAVPYTPQYPPYTDPYNPYKVTCDDQYPGVLVADRVKYGAGTTPLRTSGYSARTDVPYNNSVTLTVTTGSSGIIYTTSGPDVKFTSSTYGATTGSWHYTVGGQFGIKDFSPADTLDIDGQTTDKTLLND